jgi:hypothetical protein
VETGSLTPLERKKLTPSQLEAWDLRFGEDPPIPLREVARQLGRPEGTVMREYSQALEVLGRETGQNGGQNDLLVLDPEKGAEVVTELSSPAAESIKQVALEQGIPYSAALSIARRLDGKFLPLKHAIGSVKAHDIADLCTERGYALVASIDDQVIADMKGFQRAIAGCALIDKGELMRGKPTHVYSIQEMRGLPQLIEMLIASAEQRGLVTDVNPETQRVLMTEGELADGSPDVGRRWSP